MLFRSPRRFGKSLLLDTIGEVLGGEKELFKGLWIYKSDYDFKKHPVIRIDMSSISTETPDNLRVSILSHLEKCYKAESLAMTDKVPSDAFARLIEGLHEKYNERVVMLIDEYEKPILDHIDDFDTANENRKVIRGYGANRQQRLCGQIQRKRQNGHKSSLSLPRQGRD